MIYSNVFVGIALALVLSFSTYAADFNGRVTAIADGDTITVLGADNKQQQIRINGIDAPEKDQPFGARSKQNMERMVAGKEVAAECHKVDRYKRQVCKVWVRPLDCPKCGKTFDVGHAQIITGMAWWYRAYAKEQSAEDRGRYESAEQEAKAQKRGLWVEDSTVPPWEWRANKKMAGAP